MSLSPAEISHVIEMAWEDHTPFEIIERAYGLTEAQVIRLMRHEMKASSFRMWRARVTGRRSKHAALKPQGLTRCYAPAQYKVNHGRK